MKPKNFKIIMLSLKCDWKVNTFYSKTILGNSFYLMHAMINWMERMKICLKWVIENYMQLIN